LGTIRLGIISLFRVLPVTALAVISMATPAGAATTIGDSSGPTGSLQCASGGAPATYLQIASAAAPAPQYTAGSDGVITSWSFGAGAAVPSSLKLKIARPAGGNSRTIVGESVARAILANQLNSFATRISIMAGDQLGITAGPGPNFDCLSDGTGYSIGALGGDPPPNSTDAYPPSPGHRLSVAAVLEADADDDGYGDESQDACPGDGAAHSPPCPDRVAPNTFITEHPAKKVTKKTATFEFASGEDGSSFECSLNGGAFKACASPFLVKAKKGKNTFAVRAKDAAGNTDASPDEASWKFKKPKKK
jgi:hypothetical protein